MSAVAEDLATSSATAAATQEAVGSDPIRLPDSAQVDVVVIGGGPGGSTISTLLAGEGFSVVQLEKAQHPRFHIGESLLPNNLPILERLGVANEVRAMGVRKAGADFTCEIDGESSLLQTFRFDRALGDSPEHAWEITRAQFDELLFNNARAKGVQGFEGCTVTGVEERDSEGLLHVECTLSGGDHSDRRRIPARFVVDASGRDSFMARKNQWQKKNTKHASAAIFGHFTGVPYREGDDAGNISIYWFDQGWIWMIPLKDGRMSVGAVCWPDYLKLRNTDTETFLRQTLNRSKAAGERMKDAIAREPVRATGNYSYRSERLWGDGYLLVGDAYAFVDPVFSSGVYLAMSSAERALPVVKAALSGDAATARSAYRGAAKTYQLQVNRKISSFTWFIYRFTTPAMRDLFRNPRNDWQIEQSVISMLAGNGDGSRAIRMRLRAFRGIYQINRLMRLPETFAAWRRRRRNAKLVFADEQIMNQR